MVGKSRELKTIAVFGAKTRGHKIRFLKKVYKLLVSSTGFLTRDWRSLIFIVYFCIVKSKSK